MLIWTTFTYWSLETFRSRFIEVIKNNSVIFFFPFISVQDPTLDSSALLRKSSTQLWFSETLARLASFSNPRLTVAIPVSFSLSHFLSTFQTLPQYFSEDVAVFQKFNDKFLVLALRFFQEPLTFRQHNFGKENYPFFHFFQFFFINLKRLLKKKYLFFSQNFVENLPQKFFRIRSSLSFVFASPLCPSNFYSPKNCSFFFISKEIVSMAYSLDLTKRINAKINWTIIFLPCIDEKDCQKKCRR